MSDFNVMPRNSFSLENVLQVVEKLIMVRNKLAKYTEQLFKNIFIYPINFSNTEPNKSKHIPIYNHHWTREISNES